MTPAIVAAAPLILAQPEEQAAFVGDASVKFQVIASGTAPTYQWQVRTDGGGGDSNLTNGPGVSGAQTPTLVLDNPGAALDGNRYRCVITDGGVQVRTARTKLAVYPAPAINPGVTVSTESIFSDSTEAVSIQIDGLNIAEDVQIDRVLDTNGNGTADPGEPIVSSFAVLDGQITTFGGLRNRSVPGDDDGVADGRISTGFSLPAVPELGRTIGSYLIRVSSVEGTFRPVMRTLAVTAPAQAQSVSGQVLAGGVPVAHAVVVLLRQIEGDDLRYVASALADAAGYYSVPAAPGSYLAVAVKLGHTFPMAAAPGFTLAAGQSVGEVNLTLIPATVTIEGQATDSLGESIAGVQIFAQAGGGNVTLANSDSSGVYIVGATPDQWGLEVSELSAALAGCVLPESLPSADTTAANVEDLDLVLPRATAMVYGRVLDDLGAPIPEVRLDAGDGQYSGSGVTANDGFYYIGVVGNGAGWRVGVDAGSLALAGHQIPAKQNFGPAPDTASRRDFVAPILTGFQLWQQEHFTSAQVANPDISGLLAAPAGDGVSNLMKYALDVNPFSDASPFLPRATVANGSVAISFDAVRDELIYAPEVSTDLLTWTTAGIALVADGQHMTASFPTAGQAKVFMRLRVSSPPASRAK